MKKLFLLLLFSASLSGFSQVPDSTVPLREYNWSEPRPVTKPDTLRAELLVTYTTRRWGVAHSRDGYVVREGGRVIRFLTIEKERFPPNTKFWGWIANDEKVVP